ncbi:VOC family protein [Williamsia maris]|uniref:Glyoxalase-like domain n=1 Tax=Williamsia maris TaxID=72806 RepID=A0ABT1HKD0_9NOCA|nr:VOC family protein [Williamsia maris]MCP2178401.1 Glyoxalase-like domain [Williamsia maris]
MTHASVPTAHLALGAVNMTAERPADLAAFWAQVIGGRVAGTAGESVFVAAGDGGFAMFFRPRTHPRPADQDTHLDLTAVWGTRGSEVDRLVALGATHRWDVLDEVPWVQWSTLADPEGNLFCVAEHPPVDD